MIELFEYFSACPAITPVPKLKRPLSELLPHGKGAEGAKIEEVRRILWNLENLKEKPWDLILSKFPCRGNDEIPF